MEPEAATRSRVRTGSDRLSSGLVALVVLGQLLLLWHPAYLPSNDGPAHLYSSWVSHRLASDPRDPLARWFVGNPQSIYPNAGYAEFLEALAAWMPIRVAERIGLSLYVLALPLAVGAFARSLRRDPVLPALFAAALTFGYLFFMGFFNFLWGVPAVFAFLTVVRRLLFRWSWLSALSANALLALLFWLHLVAFGSALLGAAVLAAMRRRFLPAIGAVLPALLVTPWFWPQSVGPGARWSWSKSLWTHVEGALTLDIASAFGGVERAMAVGAGMIVMIAAIAGLGRERRGRVEIAALAGCFLLLAMTAPERIGVGAVLPERLAMFGWLFLGLGLDLGKGWKRTTAAAILVLAMIAHGLFLDRQFEIFDRTMGQYLAGTEIVPKGASLFVLTRVPKERPFVIRPLATGWSYYAMELDTPSFQDYQAAPANARLFPVTYSRDGRRRFLGEKRVEDVAVERLAAWADYVVLWKPYPRQLARLLRNGGYEVSAKRGELTVLAHERTRQARGRVG